MKIYVPQISFTKYVTKLHRLKSTCIGQRASRFNILFYGSDKFSIESLKLLHRNHCLDNDDRNKIIDKIDVVSGDNSLVTKFSRQHSIRTFSWPYEVPYHTYDVGIVVSFGHLIPKKSIEACRCGILNVHGSLLPRWRGPSPIHHAILAGDQVTGVTIMKIVPDVFDVGSILAKREYHIPRRGTTSSVYADLSVIGSELLFDTLVNLEGRLKHAAKQPPEGATKAPKPKKIHGNLNCRKMTSIEIDRRVRAFSGLIDVYIQWPLYTDYSLFLYDMIDPIEMELIDPDLCINYLNHNHHVHPGSIFYHKPRKILCFKCSDGKWVGFQNLKITNKRKMTALQFYNGFMANYCKNGLIELDSNGQVS